MKDVFKAARERVEKFYQGLIATTDTTQELAVLIGWSTARLEHSYKNNQNNAIAEALKKVLIVRGYAVKIEFDMTLITQYARRIVLTVEGDVEVPFFQLKEGTEHIEVPGYGKVTNENLEDNLVAKLLYSDSEKYSALIEPRKKIVFEEKTVVEPKEKEVAEEEVVEEEVVEEEESPIEKDFKVTLAWLKENPEVAALRVAVGDVLIVGAEGEFIRLKK
jgi:hypothetical protein